MKSFLLSLLAAAAFQMGFMTQSAPTTTQLFDGKTFRGWEGDTINTWRIENGTIAAGSPGKMVPTMIFCVRPVAMPTLSCA